MVNFILLLEYHGSLLAVEVIREPSAGMVAPISPAPKMAYRNGAKKGATAAGAISVSHGASLPTRDRHCEGYYLPLLSGVWSIFGLGFETTKWRLFRDTLDRPNELKQYGVVPFQKGGNICKGVP